MGCGLSTSEPPRRTTTTIQSPTPNQSQIRIPSPSLFLIQAIQLSRWSAASDGQIVQLAFTPGGGHVVAVVKTGGSPGDEHQFRIWNTEVRAEYATGNQSAAVPYNSGPPRNSWDYDQPQHGGLHGEQYHGRYLGDRDSDTDSSHDPFDPTRSNVKVLPVNIGRGLVDHRICGNIILDPDHEECFLWLDSLRRKICHVDIRARSMAQNVDSGMIGHPMMVSQPPDSIPGLDTLYTGVDRVQRNMVRVLGKHQSGGSYNHQWTVGHSEITHVDTTASGLVVTLSKDGFCRGSEVDSGPRAELVARIDSTSPADMVRICGKNILDVRHDYVVSTWGPNLAIWWLYAMNTRMCPNPQVYSLSERLGRRVLPLCISHDGVYLALGSHDGFDIFDISSQEVAETGLGLGIFDITKGAFSHDNRRIVVSTVNNTLYLFSLQGGGWNCTSELESSADGESRSTQSSHSSPASFEADAPFPVPSPVHFNSRNGYGYGYGYHPSHSFSGEPSGSSPASAGRWPGPGEFAATRQTRFEYRQYDTLSSSRRTSLSSDHFPDYLANGSAASAGFRSTPAGFIATHPTRYGFHPHDIHLPSRHTSATLNSFPNDIPYHTAASAGFRSEPAGFTAQQPHCGFQPYDKLDVPPPSYQTSTSKTSPGILPGHSHGLGPSGYRSPFCGDEAEARCIPNTDVRHETHT